MQLQINDAYQKLKRLYYEVKEEMYSWMKYKRNLNGIDQFYHFKAQKINYEGLYSYSYINNYKWWKMKMKSKSKDVERL